MLAKRQRRGKCKMTAKSNKRVQTGCKIVDKSTEMVAEKRKNEGKNDIFVNFFGYNVQIVEKSTGKTLYIYA